MVSTFFWGQENKNVGIAVTDTRKGKQNLDECKKTV